ncbi:MAG: hypothetical protein ACI86X_000896 [Moritella sp.]|jgi:hypothetical protein
MPCRYNPWRNSIILNAATNIPPQALFHQLILSKPGRQQVIRYLDSLSRLAYAQESQIDLQQGMLLALNALVTCDTDCWSHLLILLNSPVMNTRRVC